MEIKLHGRDVELDFHHAEDRCDSYIVSGSYLDGAEEKISDDDLELLGGDQEIRSAMEDDRTDWLADYGDHLRDCARDGH